MAECFNEQCDASKQCIEIMFSYLDLLSRRQGWLALPLPHLFPSLSPRRLCRSTTCSCRLLLPFCKLCFSSGFICLNFGLSFQFLSRPHQSLPPFLPPHPTPSPSSLQSDVSHLHLQYHLGGPPPLVPVSTFPPWKNSLCNSKMHFFFIMRMWLLCRGLLLTEIICKIIAQLVCAQHISKTCLGSEWTLSTSIMMYGCTCSIAFSESKK